LKVFILPQLGFYSWVVEYGLRYAIQHERADPNSKTRLSDY